MKNEKDYIKNKNAALEMAKDIETYWHSKGYTEVKVWVEKYQDLPSKSYAIRSNMVFKF